MTLESKVRSNVLMISLYGSNANSSLQFSIELIGIMYITIDSVCQYHIGVNVQGQIYIIVSIKIQTSLTLFDRGYSYFTQCLPEVCRCKASFWILCMAFELNITRSKYLNFSCMACNAKYPQ